MVACPRVFVPRPLVGRKLVEEMGEYYKSLKPEAQERYSFKLQCAVLSLKEDSYLIKDYSKDMRQWPIVISSYTSLTCRNLYRGGIAVLETARFIQLLPKWICKDYKFSFV